MTDIEIPVDDKPSRLDKRPDTSPVSDFDPDDVHRVDDRIALFWETYPDGAIDSSDIEQIGEHEWRVTARVWKHGDTDRPDSTASSARTRDLDGHPSGAYPLETAQSVAISRALRFLGVNP